MELWKIGTNQLEMERMGNNQKVSKIIIKTEKNPKKSKAIWYHSDLKSDLQLPLSGGW